MRILVTGGTGNVGGATLARLVAGGHAVTVVGRRGVAPVRGATYRACDVTDEAAVRDAARGFDAIVHLAAIQNPTAGSGPEVFRVNAAGTFNVFAAAEAAGIPRVVCASSINALGYNYGRRPSVIGRLPIDEAHPLATTDAYSFSKQAMEEIARYFHRRAGIASVCLRMPWVTPAAETAEERVRERWRTCAEAWKRVEDMSEEARRDWIGGLAAGWEALRGSGALEEPGMARRLELMRRDPLFAGRSDFWTLLDERDAAQAVERGLLAAFEGSHAVYVNDDHNWSGLPSTALAGRYHPGVPCAELPGTACLVDIGAARRLLGFAPEYSVERWR